MQEPITTLLSSQSIEAERIVQDDEPNDDDIMVSCADFHFDLDEDNVPDNTIISDVKVSGETSLKEHHELFVEQVKTMKEFVDLKMAALKSEMDIEAEKIEKIYSIIHGKVDVIVKHVEYNTSYLTRLHAKTEKNSQVSEKLEEFLSSIKESISKASLSNQSSVSQESFSQLISSIETHLKVKLAPILELVHVLPTNVPPAKQVSQGGEKGCIGIGSSEDTDKGVVVGKLLSAQIPTSLPISFITTSTTTTTIHIMKGILIGESIGGYCSRSMPPPSKDN
ncbi:unnamed protein product [Lactuca saligna]|uniref:Uncharacterized protein n=1 Tax=Lactuca saligna TaxID=75948 RepID=A0AA36E746_LACSI|nr:unnamed protein product [Lactuca saligna]